MFQHTLLGILKTSPSSAKVNVEFTDVLQLSASLYLGRKRLELAVPGLKRRDGGSNKGWSMAQYGFLIGFVCSMFFLFCAKTTSKMPSNCTRPLWYRCPSPEVLLQILYIHIKTTSPNEFDCIEVPLHGKRSEAPLQEKNKKNDLSISLDTALDQTTVINYIFLLKFIEQISVNDPNPTQSCCKTPHSVSRKPGPLESPFRSSATFVVI